MRCLKDDAGATSSKDGAQDPTGGCKCPSLFPWGCCLPDWRRRSPTGATLGLRPRGVPAFRPKGCRRWLSIKPENTVARRRAVVCVAAWTTGAARSRRLGRRWIRLGAAGRNVRRLVLFSGTAGGAGELVIRDRMDARWPSGVRHPRRNVHGGAHPALLLFLWVGSGALRRVRGRSSQVKGAWRRRCREGAARPP
jgi:hypothetical protein